MLVFRWTLVGCLLAVSLATAADEKKKADPKAKPAAKAPAAKTPPTKVPAKVDDSDPLKGLGVAVDLPAIAPVGKWATLGKVTVSEKLIVVMSLRYGDRCLGPGKKVELKERDDGRSWQCLATEREGAEPVEIAVFRLDQGALQFAWSAGAEQVSNAGSLKNASFEIAVAASKKVVGLRKTMRGKPLALSWDEPTTEYYEIADPPRLDSLRIEIDMPRAEFKSRNVSWRLLLDGPALKASGGVAWAEAIRPPHLLVKIDSSFSKSLKVTATPMFWIADREKPQRLTAKGLTTAITQLNAYEAKLNLARSSLPKGKSANDASKAQYDAITKELAAVRKAGDDLASLQEFVKEIKLGGIQLKVFQEVDGQTTTLLTTK
ncbi:hypothetical protein ETAA8_19070 [Anatilimnocola aggregata]|uniref:Uncharacterized protein n=1 Tax=Anatilimnocola aggregata TaxID=2528021 RepID=A0A517Y9B1_9BACT|nr:hypothetical protein [Anatilimnocola aggregata]QDU26824.1 hypothetical protein ETAA8_19070 [Anatilimnocola aggregata]